MVSPNLKIISDSFVKPAFQSEESKKPIYFSPWDLVLITANYIQKGLLFPLPEKNQGFSMTTFLEELKDSLSATLTHFHPLAARLATVKRENPGSMVVCLKAENSPGARFIHSAVDLRVADVLTPTDVPVIVESFFDHHKAVNYDGHEMSLLSIQVTELIDGIFIGCSMNHTIGDGTSYWHFFNSWSEIFRSKTPNNGLAPIPISRPPIHDRWVRAGSEPIVTLPFANLDKFINRDRPFLRTRIFRFSPESLAKLKAKVNSECNMTGISTLQSLSAVVWRCVTRARRLPAGQETSCSLAVNNRSRVSPPIPENYFGNMVLTIKGATTAGELLDQGVGQAALRLHQVVRGHGDKEIKELIDWWYKSPFVLQMGVQFDGNSVQMGSSPRFDMYGNEFGLGKALAVLSGYANKFDGKVTLYPGREGGGSMDLEVCLLPENMAAFECDEEFMSVVNGRDGI